MPPCAVLPQIAGVTEGASLVAVIPALQGHPVMMPVGCLRLQQLWAGQGWLENSVLCGDGD